MKIKIEQQNDKYIARGTTSQALDDLAEFASMSQQEAKEFFLGEKENILIIKSALKLIENTDSDLVGMTQMLTEFQVRLTFGVMFREATDSKDPKIMEKVINIYNRWENSQSQQININLN